MGEYVSTIVLGKQGRVVIPSKIREMLELQEGDSLRIEFHSADGIISLFPIFRKEELKK